MIPPLPKQLFLISPHNYFVKVPAHNITPLNQRWQETCQGGYVVGCEGNGIQENSNDAASVLCWRRFLKPIFCFSAASTIFFASVVVQRNNTFPHLPHVKTKETVMLEVLDWFGGMETRMRRNMSIPIPPPYLGSNVLPSNAVASFLFQLILPFLLHLKLQTLLFQHKTMLFQLQLLS